MQDTQQNSISNNTDEISLRDLVLVLWQGKKIIAITTALFFIGSIFIAITSPIVFQSTSKLITKTGNGGKTSQLAGLASLAGINIGMPQTSDPSAYLDEVIRDAEFLEKILSKKWYYEEDSLLLEDIWEMKKPEMSAKYKFQIKKLNKLRDGMISLSRNKKTGLLTLATYASDASLAYQLNNYILILLDEYIKNSLKSQAKENRLFVEKRIVEVKKDLENSENELIKFKEKNVVSTAPRVLAEEQRLLRRVTLNQEIYLQLRKQYELARIEEKKDQPLIEIIKKPEVPIIRAKPNKKAIVFLGLILGFFSGIMIIFFQKWYLLQYLKYKPVTK